jgi:hypothetical protein
VESPFKGDPFRGWRRVEYSPTFGSVNQNKKSVVLNLKGRRVARRLGFGVKIGGCHRKFCVMSRGQMNTTASTSWSGSGCAPLCKPAETGQWLQEIQG